MTHLRIATFNTWNCQGDFDLRLDLMRSGLKGVSADVILLQEVYAEVPSGLDVAQYLASGLDMQVVFSPARKKLRNRSGVPVLCCSGLAVLTRGTVRAQHTVRLPKDERDGERLGQAVSITIDDVDVLIANVHLSHLGGEYALRQRQLEVLMDCVAAINPYDVAIVGGDMNMTADHPAFNGLRTRHGFQRADFETPLATTLNPIEGGGGMGVIDHLFTNVRPEHRVRAFTALDRADAVSGGYPSDHMAVVADIEID